MAGVHHFFECHFLVIKLKCFTCYETYFYQAKKTNSPFYGIQYYGECWGGPGQYNRHGKSANCARIGGAYVGKGFANYVYMLTGDGM